MTPKQAAAALSERLGRSYSRQRVMQLVYSGRLGAVKVGRRWDIDHDSVAEFEPWPTGRPKVVERGRT
ncbi:MAG: helix-turn-helix domain-containing protein [Coriobacteriales bacterium]